MADVAGVGLRTVGMVVQHGWVGFLQYRRTLAGTTTIRPLTAINMTPSVGHSYTEPIKSALWGPFIASGRAQICSWYEGD